MYQPKTPVRRHCFYRLNPRIDRFVRNLGVFWANAELAWLSQLTGQTTPESAPDGDRRDNLRFLSIAQFRARVFLDARLTGSQSLKRSHDYSDRADREYHSPFEIG